MSERGGISLPAHPPQTPGLPSNPLPVPFEVFEGLNTHVPRPAIKDTEMSICDGWIGWGPSYLRTLWGTGAPITTAPAGSIVWFGWGNLVDTPVCAVLKNDGSIAQVKGDGTFLVIMPAGTIQNPNSVLGFSQWGSQYLLFAAPQTNGYWIWDGTVLFGAGTLGPTVNITNSGSNYTSQPTFTLQSTGPGSGATFQAIINNGAISNIRVTNPGSGFNLGDIQVLSISGGGSNDTAQANAGIGFGSAVQSVQVVNGGQQYSANSYATISGGGGTGASVALQAQAGVITGITIVSPGSGYTSGPTITVTDPTGAGSGFSGNVVLAGGNITSVTVTAGGSGYFANPVVTVIGDGSGAILQPQVSGGAVIGLVIINGGFGYSKALVQFSGGNNGASATVSLMPFGVSGTAIETAFSRVWVTNGGAMATGFSTNPPLSRTIFSAPGDPSNFLPSQGAGAFISNDAFLRVGYHAMRQTNGFLYLIGDSSLNYISGVTTTTTGTPPVVNTIFQDANADPQTGSPWPGSVQVFKRNIIFANASGVFVSYGGAVTKISDMLDGFYATGPITGQTANFTSAVADLYGVLRTYMLLLPVVDPIDGVTRNKLLIWDEKKWVTASQDKSLVFIAQQEINSILTAWGTDGTQIFPLFQLPNANIVKTFQTKLWAVPAYYFTKQMLRLLGIVKNFTTAAISLTVYAENETAPGNVPASGSQLLLISSGGIPWTQAGVTVAWTQAGVTVTWGGPVTGFQVFGPVPLGNSGRLLGLTVQTSAADMALLSMTTVDQVFESNV